MATIDRPTTHRDEVRLVLDLADRQFALAVGVITLLVPLGTYLYGDPTVLFYVHVSLGAFWFGMDFFFKFVMGPALDAAPFAAASAVNEILLPRSVVVAESVTVGVIGSGIGLAHLLGYLANPGIWLWAALAIGAGLLVVGFGPLHHTGTKMIVELSSESPDEERLDALLGRLLQWGLLQTVFMLAIIVAMTGLRGV